MGEGLENTSNLTPINSDEIHSYIKSEVGKLKWLSLEDFWPDGKDTIFNSTMDVPLNYHLQKCGDNDRDLLATQKEIKAQVEELQGRLQKFEMIPEKEIKIKTFDITLRKADHSILGLEVNGDHSVGNGCIIVDQIYEEGAVAAWNRQCTDRPILIGDRIVGVNGYTAAEHGSHELLRECKQSRTLKLRLERGLPYIPTTVRSFGGAPPMLPNSAGSRPLPPSPGITNEWDFVDGISRMSSSDWDQGSHCGHGHGHGHFLGNNGLKGQCGIPSQPLVSKVAPTMEELELMTQHQQHQVHQLQPEQTPLRVPKSKKNKMPNPNKVTSYKLRADAAEFVPRVASF